MYDTDGFDDNARRIGSPSAVEIITGQDKPVAIGQGIGDRRVNALFTSGIIGGIVDVLRQKLLSVSNARLGQVVSAGLTVWEKACIC